MKTVISIPDRLYEEADRLAARRGVSRNELYTHAIAQLMESRKGFGVREELDAVYVPAPNESALGLELATLQAKSIGARKW